jgi:hypothetical protein
MVATAPRQKMYEFDPMSGTTLGVVEIDIDKVSIAPQLFHRSLTQKATLFL